MALATEVETRAFFASRAETVVEVKTSEGVVVEAVGRDLYEKFLRGYTRKSWGLDPSQIDTSVTARVLIRVNTDDRYFTDTYQAMPRDGHTQMFRRMLKHPNIDVQLTSEFADVRDTVRYRKLIYTGPINAYFSFRYGRLPYRSLRFEYVTEEREWAQPVGTINYPQTEAFTRISEYKHMTGQVHPQTTLTREYPSAEGDPYYPIPRPDNQALYKGYQTLAEGTPDVFFIGRLATYRDYNMDQVVGQALASFGRIQNGSREAHPRFADVRIET